MLFVKFVKFMKFMGWWSEETVTTYSFSQQRNHWNLALLLDNASPDDLVNIPFQRKFLTLLVLKFDSRCRQLFCLVRNFPTAYHWNLFLSLPLHWVERSRQERPNWVCRWLFQKKSGLLQNASPPRVGHDFHSEGSPVVQYTLRCCSRSDAELRTWTFEAHSYKEKDGWIWNPSKEGNQWSNKENSYHCRRIVKSRIWFSNISMSLSVRLKIALYFLTSHSPHFSMFSRLCV